MSTNDVSGSSSAEALDRHNGIEMSSYSPSQRSLQLPEPGMNNADDSLPSTQSSVRLQLATSAS